jgi:hypothetical protein
VTPLRFPKYVQGGTSIVIAGTSKLRVPSLGIHWLCACCHVDLFLDALIVAGRSSLKRLGLVPISSPVASLANLYV